MKLNFWGSIILIFLISCKSEVDVSFGNSGGSGSSDVVDTFSPEFSSSTDYNFSEASDSAFDVIANKSEAPSNVSLSCKYDQIIDNSVSSPIDCNSLDGFDVDEENYSIAWNPTVVQSGSYEIKVVLTIGSATFEQIFTIQVADDSGNPFAAGNGTTDFPYEITNNTLLNEVANYPDKAFILMNDLDLTAFGYVGPATFSGSFDGNDKVIENWTVSSAGIDNIGFFGDVDGGSIQDLTLKNIDITAQDNVGAIAYSVSNNASLTNIYVAGSITARANIGGVAASISGSSAAHVHFKGSIVSSNAGSNSDVGGLFGQMISSSSLAKGSVLGVIDKQGHRVGGIAGYTSSSSISEVYSFLNIINSAGDGIGGIVGNCSSCSVSESVSRGDVVGNNNVGGILGYSSNGSLSEVIATNYLTGASANDTGVLVGLEATSLSASEAYFDKSASESLSAYGSGSAAFAYTDYFMTELKNNANFAGLSSKWTLVANQYPTLAWRRGGTCNGAGSPFGGGNGSAYSPYLICTLTQLEQIPSQDNDEVYLLKSNIDMTGTAYSPSPAYTGMFLGNYYELSNWTYTDTNAVTGLEVGLFTDMNSEAVLEDLYIDNFTLTGYRFVGVAVGRHVSAVPSQYTIMSNVHGSNSSVTSTGGTYMGGIIGIIRGRGYDLSFTNGTIDPFSSYAGGITGGLASEAILKRVNSSGTMDCNDWCGGITGTATNNSELRQAKSTMTIQSVTPATFGNRAGGIAGGMYWTAKVYHAYYEGTIGVQQWYGGLIGTHGSSAGTNAFEYAWVMADLSSGGTTNDGLIYGNDEGDTGVFNEVYGDTQASSTTDLDGSGSDTGYSGANTATMQSAGQYATWPTSIWNIPSGADYPRFTWE